MEGIGTRVLEMFRGAGKTLAICETAAGGKISASLVEVPGCSSYFKSGIVAYDAYSKTEVLRVPAELLATHGAVSAEATAALAEAVRRLFNSDYGLAESGIASPLTGRSRKPLGLAYIAVSGPGLARCETFQFEGDRAQIQYSISIAALEVLLSLNLEKLAF